MSTATDCSPSCVSPDARRNYVIHIIEGGCYLGGATLLHLQTVLPPMVKTLGGPDWLVAYVPGLMQVGSGIPLLLLMHRMDRLARFQPLLLKVGLLQRFPYLLAGLTLLLAAHAPMLALVMVVLAPILSGVAAGLGSAAWQQFVVKTVPVNRRPSLIASRNLIGCICGLFAGQIIASILSRWPGMSGYGILHIIAFVLVMLSYVLFSRIRETGPHPELTERVSLRQNLRIAMDMLRGHRELKLLIGITVCRSGQMVVLPFLSIYVISTLQVQQDFLGKLVVWQMGGGIAGCLFAGGLGDRYGAKWIGLMSLAMLAAIMMVVALPMTEMQFLLLFAGLGFCQYIMAVSVPAINMELLPTRRRATFLSLQGIVGVVATLTAAGIAAILKNSSVPFLAISLVAGSALAVGAVLTMLLPGRGETAQVN